MLEAEISRVAGLPLPQLATEATLKGFGPDGPGGPGKPGTLESPEGPKRVGIQEIARAFTPAFTGRGWGRSRRSGSGL